MSDLENSVVADQLPVSDARLNEEREHAVETLAQDLRQPLIDQLNWCDLLTTDSDHGLHANHLEWVAKINRTANDLLGQVQDLLDEQKIQERARATEHPNRSSQKGGTPPPESGLVTQTWTGHGPSDGLPTHAAPPTCGTDLYAPRRSNAKVLLIEGSPTLRDLLAGALRSTFHVMTAADGREALQLMVERPDVIITEANLARVDLVSMIRCVRRIREDVAVLVMHDAEEAALLAGTRRQGICEFLQKPFPVSALVERVGALAAARGTRANKSVLVVCPDPHEGCALYDLFDARYRTYLASSRKAARYAAGGHFDLLIMDTAAGEDWWEDVVTLHREPNKHIRVLALVGGSDRDTIGSLQQLRVNSVVLKPYSCDDLLASVRDLLGIKELDSDLLRSGCRRAVT